MVVTLLYKKTLCWCNRQDQRLYNRLLTAVITAVILLQTVGGGRVQPGVRAQRVQHQPHRPQQGRREGKGKSKELRANIENRFSKKMKLKRGRIEVNGLIRRRKSFGVKKSLLSGFCKESCRFSHCDEYFSIDLFGTRWVATACAPVPGPPPSTQPSQILR